MAAAFSIRGLAQSLRGTQAAGRGPLDLAAKDLPRLEVRAFRWWEDELAAVQAAGAAAKAVAEPEVDDEEEEEAPGHRRAPKKRSMDDLFAAAPAVGAVNGPKAAEDEEVLGDIYKRSKEMRRRRRQEEAAAAAAEEEPETSAAGERRAAEANFSRKKSLEKPNIGDELDTTDASKEHEGGHHLSTEREKVPDLKRRKHGKLKNSLQKKAERLKYIESRRAIKAGKQRDIKKVLPLPSILKKKFLRHTSVKMVKEKHGRSKGPGVIYCHKSVKRVKFSEANDAPVSKKQCSKRPQLDIYKLLLSDSTTSSSSSSIEMPSEGEHIIAESSSSHMPEKTFSRAKEANENTNHDNQCGLHSTGLSTHLFDLNVALSEPNDVSNSDVTYLEHTQVGTSSVDQSALDIGRTNHKDSSCNIHGLEKERQGTDLDATKESKSPYTVQDSVQLQNWCSMTMHHGVSQLSTGGEPSSFQFQGRNFSHSEKQNFHSETNRQGSRPSAGQTLRLMGQDLAVSDTRVDFLSEAAQKHINPTKDHLTTKVVLELPRRGQPFLSLQAQSISNVSASSAITVSQFSSSASTAQVHFGYRTSHNVSHPLPPANVFSGDPSQYEDRSRDFTNLQSHRNVLLGYPPLSNHGSAAVLQNSPPWRHYSDHSTRTNSPSAPLSTTMMQQVPPSLDYRASLPQSYGVYSASSAVHAFSPASFTWSHPDQIVQGVPESRASAALPSRNAGAGTARGAPVNSNTSSSNRFVLRSGPVKLSAGAKHILIPNENTEDSNSAPMYSRVSFGSSGNVSAPHQNKGAGSRKF